MSTEAIVAIGQLIANYGHAADSPDGERLGEVFTEDAVFRSDASGMSFEGLAAIRSWFALGKPPHPYSHQTTNVYVYEIDGDTARVKSKFIGLDPETGTPWTGDYDDRVVLTAGGWRIAERVSSNRHGGYDFKAAAARATGEA
jgi:ketosteroid isomerase-like protein